MSGLSAFHGARIFDGDIWHENAVLVIEGAYVRDIVPSHLVPSDAARVDLDGGMLVPGFIDLQVNGGGGVLLNDQPDRPAIETICSTHARFGSTAVLPTLISDTPAVTEKALAAGIEAADAGVPGFLGLHIEGPHLAPARKGAHASSMLRPMDDSDFERLVAARKRLPNLLTTVAAEVVDPQRIAALSGAGVLVSLGHSDAGYKTAVAAAGAGARMVTHLFNAMSPLGHREPGMVGAALETGTLFAGLIADGYHVDRATMAIALRAKNGPGRIFLVTDAMSPIGTNVDRFTLNGREIFRSEGCLRLADGTLAGADLTMIDAIANVHHEVGLPLEEALRAASLYPAEAMGIAESHGRFGAGTRADIVHLTDDITVRSVWIGGQAVHTN